MSSLDSPLHMGFLPLRTVKCYQGVPTNCSTLASRRQEAKAVAFIEEQMKRHSIPGIALSVVFKNETIPALGFGTKAHGHADVAVTADTMFQIGSFTKTFIALAIAKFVDDGKMQWSDPVKQHLAWFSLQAGLA